VTMTLMHFTLTLPRVEDRGMKTQRIGELVRHSGKEGLKVANPSDRGAHLPRSPVSLAGCKIRLHHPPPILGMTTAIGLFLVI
jgi:hypothetical protein